MVERAVTTWQQQMPHLQPQHSWFGRMMSCQGCCIDWADCSAVLPGFAATHLLRKLFDVVDGLLHGGHGRLAQLLRLVQHVLAKRPQLCAPVCRLHRRRDLRSARLHGVRHRRCHVPEVERAARRLLLRSRSALPANHAGVVKTMAWGGSRRRGFEPAAMCCKSSTCLHRVPDPRVRPPACMGDGDLNTSRSGCTQRIGTPQSNHIWGPMTCLLRGRVWCPLHSVNDAAEHLDARPQES